MEGGELLGMGVVICHSQSKRRKGAFRVGDVSPEEFHCFSLQTEEKWIKQGDKLKEEVGEEEDLTLLKRDPEKFSWNSGDSTFPRTNPRGGEIHLCVTYGGRTSLPVRE